jgi:hypothetical protein
MKRDGARRVVRACGGAAWRLCLLRDVMDIPLSLYEFKFTNKTEFISTVALPEVA